MAWDNSLNHYHPQEGPQSEATEAEMEFERVKGEVMKACSDAWQKHPLDSEHAQRWLVVSTALNKAAKELDEYVAFRKGEIAEMADWLERTREVSMDGGGDGGIAAFRQGIECYLSYFENAIERRRI